MKNHKAKLLVILLATVIALATFSNYGLFIGSRQTQTVLASTALQENMVYTIVNKYSNLCLDVVNYSGASGAKLNQYYSNIRSNQKFKLKKVSADIYKIIPMSNSSLSIDASNGPIMQIYDENSTSAQQFKIIDDGSGANSFKILTASSGFTSCLTVLNNNISEPVRYSTYNGTSKDQWYFNPYNEADVAVEDGGIYFIKNQKSDLYLDVVNYSGENGAKLNQYSWHQNTNQQFKLKRIEGNDIYEIIPLTNANRRVDIDAGSTANGAAVQIWDSYGNTAQKFKIVNVEGNSKAFKILTGTTNYTKCLAVQNASTSNSAMVIQWDYGYDSDSDNDHWYFEKYSDLKLHTDIYCDVGNGSLNVFDVIAPAQATGTVPFVFMTTGLKDTRLYLYEDNVLVSSNDDYSYPMYDRNARITYKLRPNKQYQVRVKLYSSSHSGNFNLRFYPEKEVYFNSNDHDDNNNSRYISVEKSIDDLNKMGYYVNHMHNSTKNKILLSYINAPNGLNNDYWFIRSHGSENGKVMLSSSDSIMPSEFPEMNNVKLAVIAICHGGATGNAADVAVNQRGAQAALGWADSIYTDGANFFTDVLWTEIGKGASIESAIQTSKDKAYWHFIFHTIIWDNAILNPILYKNSGTASSFNVTEKSVTLKQEEIKFTNERNITELVAFSTKSNYIVLKDKYYSNVTRYVRTINGLMTNEIYTVVNVNGVNKLYKTNYDFTESDCVSVAKLKFDQSALQIDNKIISGNLEFNLKKVSAEDNFYLQTDDGVIPVHRKKIIYNSELGYETMVEKFFNLQTGKEIPSDIVNNYFR